MDSNSPHLQLAPLEEHSTERRQCSGGKDHHLRPPHSTRTRMGRTTHKEACTTLLAPPTEGIIRPCPLRRQPPNPSQDWETRPLRCLPRRPGSAAIATCWMECDHMVRSVCDVADLQAIVSGDCTRKVTVWSATDGSRLRQMECDGYGMSVKRSAKARKTKRAQLYSSYS